MKDAWSVIECEVVNDRNWIQVAYRNSVKGFREYWILGAANGQDYEESYHSDTDDNKRLAYSYYYDKMTQLESL